MEVEPNKKAPVVFEAVRHPVLRSLDPKDAVDFIRDREMYEIELDEKESDGSNISPASYKVSIDPLLLRSAHAIGVFDAIAPGVQPENLTDEHIKSFISALASEGGQKEPNA